MVRFVLFLAPTAGMDAESQVPWLPHLENWLAVSQVREYREYLNQPIDFTLNTQGCFDDIQTILSNTLSPLDDNQRHSAASSSSVDTLIPIFLDASEIELPFDRSTDPLNSSSVDTQLRKAVESVNVRLFSALILNRNIDPLLDLFDADHLQSPNRPDFAELNSPSISLFSSFPDNKVGAFYVDSLTGSGHILLNQQWLESGPDQIDIESVLLEEYGHYLDYCLNGKKDSEGDEGYQFSNLILGKTPSKNVSISDHGFLLINGIPTPVEFATRDSLTLDVDRQSLVFNDFTNIVGDGTSQGDLVKYNNVITIDGQSVDALVEVLDLVGTSVLALDSIEVPTKKEEYLQPRISGYGYLELGIEFYESGSYTGGDSGNQVTLQNVLVNSYDIDLLQYQTFSGFSSYELADSTDLSVTLLSDNSVRFRDDGYQRRDGIEDIRARVRVFYDSMTSFKMRMANDDTRGGQSFFALDFSVGVDWMDPSGNPITPETFETPARSILWSNINFQEQNTNDGSITGTAVAELRNPSGASFAGNKGDAIAFNEFNVPDGLTAVVTKTDDITASITFSGQATAHDTSDSLNNIIIEFQDASFQDVLASDVTASTRSDISIDFINVAPTISNSTLALDYYEGDGKKNVDKDISITDEDNVNLTSASISISSGYEKAEDQLVFNDQNGITGSWDNDTGVLTLTGSASVSNYQSALRSIAYENANEDNPSSSTRTITFSVSDGNKSSSDVDVDIRVIPVNDAPSLALLSESLSYTEGDGAKVIDDKLTLADVDSTSLTSASISISSEYVAAEDQLVFNDQNGITGSWDNDTGVLTLTGSASISDYQSALRSIAYENTNTNEPSLIQRKIQFVVSDGVLSSQVKELVINLTPITVSTYTNVVESGIVLEGNAVELQATLSGASSSEAVQFSFSVLGDSTALAGTDYQIPPTFTNGVTLIEGTDWLSIPAGVSEFKISFETIDDLDVETTETLITELSDLQDITYLTDGAGTALKMSSINVNEGSPYAVFRADGVEGQKIKFEIIPYVDDVDGDADSHAADDNPGSKAASVDIDIKNSIQKHNGKNWVDLPQGLFTGYPTGSTTLLVRIPINNDALFEDAESFKLKATAQAVDPILSDDNQQIDVIAFGIIGDDSRGPIYNESGAINPYAKKDDDRGVRVENILVNEASDWAVFTVTQSDDLENPIEITLSVSDDDPLDNNQLQLVAGEGGFDPAGPDLVEYWDGASWRDYEEGNKLNLSADSPLFVRVDISVEQDDVFEGKTDPKALVQGESFRLNVHYGAATIYGTSEIRDEGSGVIFTGEISDDNPVVSTDNLVDDLDKDGIAPHVEEILATLASSSGKGGADGDLNNDGLPDAEQSAVATLAWIDAASFDSAQAGELVDIKPIISLSALEGPDDYTVNREYQLMQIDVLAGDDINYLDGSGRPSGSSIVDAPWDALKFELEAIDVDGDGVRDLPDIDNDREGTQVRLSIDVSRSEIVEGELNAFYKYVSRQALNNYQNAGLDLYELDGTQITEPGWYDFTQLEDGGDGASFVFEDGFLTRINLIITDNSFGDSDPTLNRILDPGTPVRVASQASTSKGTSSDSKQSEPVGVSRLVSGVPFILDNSSRVELSSLPLSVIPDEVDTVPARHFEGLFVFGRSGLPPERRFLVLNSQPKTSDSHNALAVVSGSEPQGNPLTKEEGATDPDLINETDASEQAPPDTASMVSALGALSLLFLAARRNSREKLSSLLNSFSSAVPWGSKSARPYLLFAVRSSLTQAFVCYLACPSSSTLHVVPICSLEESTSHRINLSREDWLVIQSQIDADCSGLQPLLLCDQRITLVDRPSTHCQIVSLDILAANNVAAPLFDLPSAAHLNLYSESESVRTPAHVVLRHQSLFDSGRMIRKAVPLGCRFDVSEAAQLAVLISCLHNKLQ